MSEHGSQSVWVKRAATSCHWGIRPSSVICHTSFQIKWLRDFHTSLSGLIFTPALWSRDRARHREGERKWERELGFWKAGSHPCVLTARPDKVIKWLQHILSGFFSFSIDAYNHLEWSEKSLVNKDWLCWQKDFSEKSISYKTLQQVFDILGNMLICSHPLKSEMRRMMPTLWNKKLEKGES